MVGGFAPKAFGAVVPMIHIAAAWNTDKAIAGEAAVALVFAGAGLIGWDTTIRNTAIE